MPSDKKKARLSLTLSPDTLCLIDKARGPNGRSSFIDQVLMENVRSHYSDRKTIRKFGAVYTPPQLASFLAQRAIEALPEQVKAKSNTNLRVLDPACGGGDLLTTCWRELAKRLKYKGDPLDTLCGVDINEDACTSTIVRIGALSATDDYRIPKVHRANSLLPRGGRSAGWKTIMSSMDAEDGFDIIIANPPWGADFSTYRKELLESSYELLRGQADTSDLFVEQSLSMLKPNGVLAFIVPDSLFSLERHGLRRFLTERTRIRMVARLGEGLFEGINRGCAIIVVQPKSKDAKTGAVSCFRLTPEARRRVINNETSLQHEFTHSSHTVMQDRFAENSGASFDIDLKVSGESLLKKFISGHDLGQYLTSTRGVELSKSGKVVQCGHCRMWLPVAADERPHCSHCDKNWLPGKEARIVASSPAPRAMRYIVGKDVERYKVTSSLWIKTDFPGINYKEKGVYTGPKILVRKTGVGISAAIDYSNAHTNQVVYILKKKDGAPKNALLEFFLAALSSRAIHYYLAQKGGETEWRSHPYLTQSQLMALPIPNEASLRRHDRTVKNVAKLVRRISAATSADVERLDAQLERGIATVYGLNRADYLKIYESMEQSQQLLPIRRLRNISVADIFG